VGVLRVEHVVAEVAEPRGPEEEALFGVAGRVVGERVRQVVEDAERAHEIRRDVGQAVGGATQAPDRRAHVAGERPQLVADDRRRGAQERTGVTQGRAERARRRAQVAERRAERPAEPVDLAERGVGDLQRLRELLQRAAQVAVLVGEGAEDGVRAVDELGELVVLLADGLDQQAQVVDRAADVAAPALELAGELAQVASARLEALEGGGEVVAPALEALAAAVDEQAQVVARVAVQRGEDLLELDVGQRVLDGTVQPSGTRSPRPGDSSMTMSSRPVFGRRSIVASLRTRSK
jgi:hypothetical protein